MAHFAKLDENGIVTYVIRLDNEDAPDPAPENSETIGQAFIAQLAELNPDLTGTWVQTSYNGTFRKQYAEVGGKYLPDADVFVLPQPYPSWTLDENFDWQPPVPMPTDGHAWVWDEQRQEWVDEILISGNTP